MIILHMRLKYVHLTNYTQSSKYKTQNPKGLSTTSSKGLTPASHIISGYIDM